MVKGNERMLGLFLDRRLRRAMGGARRMEIFHQGKLLVDLPLAQTPTSAALGKCTQPKGRQTDSE